MGLSTRGWLPCGHQSSLKKRSTTSHCKPIPGLDKLHPNTTAPTLHPHPKPHPTNTPHSLACVKLESLTHIIPCVWNVFPLQGLVRVLWPLLLVPWRLAYHFPITCTIIYCNHSLHCPFPASLEDKSYLFPILSNTPGLQQTLSACKLNWLICRWPTTSLII